MFRIAVCLFVLQLASSEPPPHCRGPPPGVVNPHACCKFPPVFKEEDFKECGIEKPSDDENRPKRGPPDCSKQICLLKRNNLMKDDTDVDKEAGIAFMDKWAAENPDFKDAVDKAKERCLSGDLPGPPNICEPSKTVFCISTTMFIECPKWEDTDNCKKLKEHFDECKQYLPK